MRRREEEDRWRKWRRGGRGGGGRGGEEKGRGAGEEEGEPIEG